MYLIENTFSIPIEDLKKIAILFEPFVFKFFPKWKSLNADNLRKLSLDKEVTLMTLSAKDLQSIFTDISMKTALESSLVINLGIYNRNEYSSFNNSIKVGLNLNLLRKIQIIGDDNYSLSVLSKKLNTNLSNQLSRVKFLDSLAHEISHWLDNYYHNNFIFNKTKDLISNDKTIKQVYNSDLIDRSYLEINAQIHAIKNLKSIFNKTWDKLTIFDVLNKDSSLKGLYRYFSEPKSKQYASDWVKTLMKRMSREGLLGKNMSHIPSNDAILLVENFICLDYELNNNYNIETFI